MGHSQRFRKSPCGLQRPNEAGEVEDENLLILSSDKELFTSVMDRVSQMLSSTPAFTGISGSVDLFQPPTALPPQTEIIEASAITPVFDVPEVTVRGRPVGNRKLKRSFEWPNYIISLCNSAAKSTL